MATYVSDNENYFLQTNVYENEDKSKNLVCCYIHETGNEGYFFVNHEELKELHEIISKVLEDNNH